MTTAPPEEGWQRLHPATIIKELGALAWALVAAIIFDFDEPDLPWTDAGPEAVIAVGVFGFATLRYLFTAYRITDQSLELRRGVLVKSFQSMPRDRIQSVGTHTGLIGRFVGVTTIVVSAADTEDIQLSFVSEEAAAGLRRILEQRRAEASPEMEGERRPLASLDSGRLLTFGLTETGLVPAVLVLVASIVVVFAFGWIFAPLSVGWVIVWPVLRTFSLVGFGSWIQGDRVLVQAGLLSRRRSESPLGRIQAVQVSRPPLRRLIGMETVSIVTGDIGSSSESAQIAGTIAPLETIGTWRSLCETLVGRVDVAETSLEPSSRHTIRRMITRGSVILALPVAGLAVTMSRLGWPLWALGIVAAISLTILVLYARARWRVLGWSVDDRHLLVRRGVMLRRLIVVPVHKVQDVTIRKTLFQRRLGIATVEVDTAGTMLSGRVMAIDLETERAADLAERLTAVAARVALPDGV
ncbi:MAG TPA: PH domain-containing protein [Acidimicrobiia bacterium]|nr:PH domain-containing protein [Acidimicrobiia bacterium]